MLLQDIIINQKHLENVVRSLYSNEEIYTNVRDGAVIRNPETGVALEVDVWIPSLKLCFEFQDIYHYGAAFYYNLPLQSVQTRDNLKSEKLQQINETLVTVPYWWIGDSESLLATIQFQRPDLDIDSICDPIPLCSIPYESTEIDVVTAVPGIGELMLASFTEKSFLTNMGGSVWWTGEKYDGVRFCWHPMDRVIYSRRGIEIPAAANTKRNFGNFFIDGEFWSGRGLFLETVGLISPMLHVELSKLIAFDIPSLDVRNDTYEKRYATLLSHISKENPILIVPGRTICKRPNAMLFLLNSVLDFGGEGIILQKFNSLYESGRSSVLFKMKTPMATDEEALVVTSTSTQLTLQFPNGDTFVVPRENRAREVKKGDVVTVSSTKYSQHLLPLDPVVTCVRTDVTWEQVVAQYYSLAKVKAKKAKYDHQGATAFFTKFAKKKNFDPLFAANWYSVSRAQVEMEKTGRTILLKYGPSLAHALKSAFPQIGLESSKFMTKSVNFWKDKHNQRNYIIKTAKQLGFDPLIARNWLSPKARKLRKSFMIQKYYNANLTKALRHLLPEVGFKETFKKKAIEIYDKLKTKTTRQQTTRQLLIDFAISKGLDPLKSETWYQYKFDDSKESNPRLKRLKKQILSIVGSYEGGWVQCVRDSFDDLNLDPFLFRFLPSKYWDSTITRKDFFVRFAKKQGFDPMDAQNWYKVTFTDIRNTKYGKSVLKYYPEGLRSALKSIFLTLT